MARAPCRDRSTTTLPLPLLTALRTVADWPGWKPTMTRFCAAQLLVADSDIANKQAVMTPQVLFLLKLIIPTVVTHIFIFM